MSLGSEIADCIILTDRPIAKCRVVLWIEFQDC